MSERYTPPGPRPWWEDCLQVANYLGPVVMAFMAGWAWANQQWFNLAIAAMLPIFNTAFLIHWVVSERRLARKHAIEWAAFEAEEDARQ